MQANAGAGALAKGGDGGPALRLAGVAGGAGVQLGKVIADGGAEAIFFDAGDQAGGVALALGVAAPIGLQVLQGEAEGPIAPGAGEGDAGDEMIAGFQDRAPGQGLLLGKGQGAGQVAVG